MANFPGATAEPNSASYSIIGAPLDISTTFRPGTRFGPDRIRRCSRPFDGYDHRTGLHFGDLVTDTGDLAAWDDAAEYLQFLEGELIDQYADGRTPLLMGGEHTVTVAGVRACDPDVYVCLDAHLDLYDAYADNELSHATVTRRALETADEAILIGVRTGSEAEWDRASEADVTVIPPEEVSGWEPVVDGDVYLSVDIDAVDPGFAPGTGTPAPFGLEPKAVRDIIRAVAPLASGFDIVEVNDRDHGQAAALGGKLLQEFVFSHAASAIDA